MNTIKGVSLRNSNIFYVILIKNAMHSIIMFTIIKIIIIYNKTIKQL